MGVAELRGVCVCVHEWLLKHVKCVIGHIGVMVQSNYIQYVTVVHWDVTLQKVTFVINKNFPREGTFCILYLILFSY